MIKPIFIDDNINIYHSTEAKKLLSHKNDKCYMHNGEIINVTKNRWQEAQYYEYKTWMTNGLFYDDDRNYEHLDRFNNYSTVIFDNINFFIELGCGPFTNTRLIIDRFKNDTSIHLLDPLIDEYKNHPKCFYKNTQYKNKHLVTIASSIEDFNTDIKYDCILMNNVLEHCFDIPVIFKKILSLLQPNGILIFSDVCFLKKDIEVLSENTYDAGHPLRISKDSIEKFLENFNTLFCKDFYGLYNQSWRIDKYFIGNKI